MPRPKGSTNKAKKAPATIDFDFVELGGQIFENKEGATVIELHGNKREFESSKHSANWLKANIGDIKGALESENSDSLHDIFTLAEGEEDDDLFVPTATLDKKREQNEASTVKSAVSSILGSSLSDYYKTCVELGSGEEKRLNTLLKAQEEEGHLTKEEVCDYYGLDEKTTSDIDLMLALSAKGISVEIGSLGYRVSYEAPSFY